MGSSPNWLEKAQQPGPRMGSSPAGRVVGLDLDRSTGRTPRHSLLAPRCADWPRATKRAGARRFAELLARARDLQFARRWYEHNACLAEANWLALLPPNALLRATPFRADAGPEGRGMTNTRKILIVDDDSELREALVEQLAQLRQHEASEDAVFTIGPYTFRPSSKILLNPKGNKVRLTEKETAILRYLYRAGQRPVSRETLLQEVWGYNSGVTTHTLETHIYRLRQKVEKDAASPAILVTEAGGYKLVP